MAKRCAAWNAPFTGRVAVRWYVGGKQQPPPTSHRAPASGGASTTATSRLTGAPPDTTVAAAAAPDGAANVMQHRCARDAGSGTLGSGVRSSEIRLSWSGLMDVPASCTKGLLVALKAVPSS